MKLWDVLVQGGLDMIGYASLAQRAGPPNNEHNMKAASVCVTRETRVGVRYISHANRASKQASKKQERRSTRRGGRRAKVGSMYVL